MGLAGFLSPAAAQALANVGKAAARAPTPPIPRALPVAVPGLVARGAAAGLARGALAAAMPVLLAYEIWQLTEQIGALMRGKSGWELPPGLRWEHYCTGSGTVWVSATYRNCTTTISRSRSTLQYSPTPGATVEGLYIDLGPNAVSPSFQNLKTDGYVIREYGTPANVVPVRVDRAGAFIPAGDVPFSPFAPIDPLSVPPGRMMPPVAPQVLPFRALPFRQTNPYRSPIEQSQRGNAAPFLQPIDVVVDAIGGRPLPGRTMPGRRAPQRVRPSRPAQPGRVVRDRPARPVRTTPQRPQPEAPKAPGRENPNIRPPRPPRPPTPPREWPQEGGFPEQDPRFPPIPDLPGWVAEPAPGTHAPDVRPGELPGENVGWPAAPSPGASPVREEWPMGAIGPTLTYGPGTSPAVGQHVRQPPRAREKERKSRAVQGVGSSLIMRRAVSPATEALDALDCVWSALPKARRWAIQKADWKRQKAEGRTPAPKAKIKGQEFDGRPASIDLGFVKGMEGQSVSLPGTGRKLPGYADPTANHILPLTPQQKAAAAYRYANEIDLNAMTACMLANQFEDALIGRVGQQMQAAGKRMGHTTGLGTGPTF